MDILPIKFRSPPPKPPRRRHSDQLSISPSGTFPSSRKKYFGESQRNSDNQQGIENSPSSCGSLPSNWTPDFSLVENIENVPVFKEQNCSNNHVKNAFQHFSVMGDVFDKLKSSLGNVILSETKNSSDRRCSLRCEPPFIHRIVKKDALASEHHSKNLVDFFHTDISELNDTKQFSNSRSSEFFFSKSLHKDYHRRHNSDPLPLDFDNKNSSSFSQFSSLDISNKLFNCDHSFESKENQCLLQENKSLKEINGKLWEHLCSAQALLDSMKKSSVDNSNSLSVSELLSSLHDALKAKDSAMEDRMRIVLQERDNAVQDLDSMVQVVAGSFEDNYCTEEDKSSDKEIKELLKDIEVTCSPFKLIQQQRLLLSHLYRSKELKQDHMLHEIKLTTSERDNLRVKVKLLEEELNHLKLSNEIWNTDNKYWESSLLNTLCQVIQQRDVAVKNYSAHNMEYFNSRSSVHEKSFDSDELNDCLQRLDGTSVKKKIFQSPQNDIRKYPPYSLKSKSDEIRYLKEEILILNKSLEIEMEKRENAEEKCIRLERLVNVLQKKINGQNVGIPV